LHGAILAQNVEQTLALLAPGSTVAQVGVLYGDLTELLLGNHSVAKLLLLDHFDLHTQQHAAARLDGHEHRSFIETRFATAVQSGTLETQLGRVSAIRSLPAEGLDACFIRGCHEYEQLLDELYMCDTKLRPGGHIWVADYIMADYTSGKIYEVVRAVNEFATKASYDLVYLVLEHTMFCTVVLRRPG
jgi:hypothetical protein